MTRLSSLSVLLPVYNGKEFLRQAVDSVLSQGDVLFDLLVIDDGSTDDSSEELSRSADQRIHVYRQANRGLAATLNRGLELASGKYIARQDQDDLVLPGRLAKQVAFLDKNPDCAMVGTWSQIWVGIRPTRRGHYHPASHEALRLELLFDNPFVHSSVMLRADAVRNLGGYCEDKSRQPPEDYELWSRIALKHRVANLPEVLTAYREVEGSMSRTGERPFLANVIRISSENLAAVISPEFSEEACFALASLYHGRFADAKIKEFARVRALQMHQRAALSLGGEVAQWSDEFSTTFNRQRAHINAQFFWRYIPGALIGSARRIKRFLASMTGFLAKG